MMLRARRHRVVVILAVLSVLLLYHFRNARPWQELPASVQQLRQYEHKKESGEPGHTSKEGNGDKTEEAKDAALQPPAIFTPAAQPLTADDKGSQARPTMPTESDTTSGQDKPVKETSASSKIDGGKEQESPSLEEPTRTSTASAGKGPTSSGSIQAVGHGRLEVLHAESDEPAVHWIKRKEHFPVPEESLKALPTGKPTLQPRIQFAFKDESPSAKAARLERLVAIKGAFEHSWNNYREHAWGHDEVSPVSGGHRDPFNGWGATLVDALDTLWIMGLEEDFKAALEAVEEIDFTTSLRADIPLFESTIRYLGGLLGAYDISGGKHKGLINKAVELAEVLMGAFDTPNRMPQSFYQWKP